MRMPAKTRNLMIKYAHTFKPSSARAQCLAIANYTLNYDETIAERVYRDHSDSSSHLRAAKLLVDAGCAVEENGTESFYGKFVFEDGSSF